VCESIGNRSSVDEARSDGPEEETTVVEPEQGNGEIQSSWEKGGGIADGWHSALTYHLAVEAWCRSESGRTTDVHFGA
jgi:hypothetical protein